jgi:DNA polymerase-3 subunit alpha
MDTPEHNWVANDFVVSNSHGVSYALISYRTAYAKANYPLEFFKSMLTFSESKQDSLEEIQELVFEARFFGLNIKPPHLSLGNMDFAKLDSKTIVFGLGHIKGVGESAHKQIDTLRTVKDPNEFLLKCFENKVRKDVVVGLIKSGTVDYLGRQRLQLYRDYATLSELTPRELDFVRPLLGQQATVDGAFNTLINSKIPNKARKPRLIEARATIEKLTGGSPKRTAIAWEKHYLGVPLSGSLVDLYHNDRVNIKCANLPKLKEGTSGAMGVVIEKVRTIKDKRGQWMAFLSVSDDTYMCDNVVVFASRYLTIGWIIEEGRPVLITGKKNKGSFVAYDITHL